MMPFRGNRPPNPELFAAYFDGEFEGRDDLIALKQRIEAWLADNPEARADQARYRQLLRLWQAASPPELDSSRWDAMLAELQALAAQQPAGPTLPHRRRGWRLASRMGVTAAAVATIFLVWPTHEPVRLQPITPVAQQQPVEDEVLQVAVAEEVTILRVEGADTQTLVVGVLPLSGALELVSANEVVFTSMQPDATDAMLPELRVGASSTPLIWARADSED